MTTGGFGGAHLVAAGALGLGHAATEAIHLGREHVTASRGALPVAGTDVAAAASVPATAPAPAAAVRVSSASAAPAAAVAAAALVVAAAAAVAVLLVAAALLAAPIAHVIVRSVSEGGSLDDASGRWEK